MSVWKGKGQGDAIIDLAKPWELGRHSWGSPTILSWIEAAFVNWLFHIEWKHLERERSGERMYSKRW